MKKRVLSILLVLTLILGMLPASASAVTGAESTGNTPCLAVQQDAPTAGTIKSGEIYDVELADVFSCSENHTVTYGFTTNVESPHNKIKDGKFYFSAPEGA